MCSEFHARYIQVSCLFTTDLVISFFRWVVRSPERDSKFIHYPFLCLTYNTHIFHISHSLCVCLSPSPLHHHRSPCVTERCRTGVWWSSSTLMTPKRRRPRSTATDWRARASGSSTSSQVSEPSISTWRSSTTRYVGLFDLPRDKSHLGTPSTRPWTYLSWLNLIKSNVSGQSFIGISFLAL